MLSVNGHIEAGDRVVTDAHDHAPVDWTVTGILAKSSNVGTIMLAREVGDEKLEHYLRAFGIGSTTGIELPGESAGILQDSDEWSGIRAANVAIGQGVSVTTLQMASVYQAIANDGVRIEPRVVASVTDPAGRVTPAPEPASTRVISESTADRMAYMLEAVVGTGGTAPLGAIEGFRVAGKTGTAQRANPECNCYAGGGYVTTFVGFAPADDPQYVVAVDLERPTSSAEGGQVAAPVFADILRFALTADGIVPSGTARPDFVLTGPCRPSPSPGRTTARGRYGSGRGERSCAGRLGFHDRVRLRVGAPHVGQPSDAAGRAGRSARPPGRQRPEHRARPARRHPGLRRGAAGLPLRRPARRAHPRRAVRRRRRGARRGRHPHRPDRPGRGRAAGLPVCVVADPAPSSGPWPTGSTASPAAGSPSSASPGPTARRRRRTSSRPVSRPPGTGTGLIGTVQTRTRTVGPHGEERVTALPSVRTTPEAPALHELLASMADDGVSAVVMEVSSHALVLGRVGGIRFAAAGFTNLGRDHLDFHADLDDYFRQARPCCSTAAPRSRSSTSTTRRPPARRPRPGAGRSPCRAPRAPRPTGRRRTSHPCPAGGSTFTLHGPGGRTWPARLRLPGRFNVANAVLAVALLDAIGIPVETALAGLAETVVPGRMEPVDAGQPFVAVVDYAHTPDAVSHRPGRAPRRRPAG